VRRLALVPCLLSLLGIVSTCGDPPSATTVDDIEQEYLFEVERVNYAWGFEWVGLVIDREGNVYAFDHSHEPWQPASNGSYSEAELPRKYEHGMRLVGNVDQGTLVAQLNRIPDVGVSFDEPLISCADAGQLTYRAFRYVAETARYVPLVLREEGDRPRQNTSNAGEALSDWLRNLIPTLDEPGITPFPEGSCTP
jgi:hypothetical protein